MKPRLCLGAWPNLPPTGAESAAVVVPDIHYVVRVVPRPELGCERGSGISPREPDSKLAILVAGDQEKRIPHGRARPQRSAPSSWRRTWRPMPAPALLSPTPAPGVRRGL